MSAAWPVDLLLTGGLVITQDDDRAVRRVVLDDRKIVGIDEADAIARAGVAAAALVERARLDGAGAWPWA